MVVLDLCSVNAMAEIKKMTEKELLSAIVSTMLPDNSIESNVVGYEGGNHTKILVL